MNILCTILAVLLAPLLPGVINQTKAFFAGRRGPGVFRLYADLFKLMRKSCPRSTTSTWLFDLAPALSLATVICAAAVFPWTGSWHAGGAGAVIFFYLLGTSRFFTVLGALDTGSAFEGMGASREVQFSALVEPIVFVILGFLVLLSGDAILGPCPSELWKVHPVPLILAVLAFAAVILCENCRVPFDDPETHLELTMIHEAMILDNAGPDLAFILLGSAVKLAVFSAFVVAMALPQLPGGAAARTLAIFVGLPVVAVAIGIVESVIARMRFLKTPQILLTALMTATLATLLIVLF